MGSSLAFASTDPHRHRRSHANANGVSHIRQEKGVARFVSSISTEADRRLPDLEATSASDTNYYSIDGQQQQFVTVPSPEGFNVNSLSILQLAICGGLASMLGDVIMHPVDCIKTLQQSDAGMNLNVWQAALALFQQSGVAGFYHGLWTYAGTDMIGSALKFASFEYLKRLVDPLLPPNSTRHYLPKRFALMLVCAALGFLASSVVSVPGELLKQQLQMGYYTDVGQALQGLYQQAGNSIFGLYHGYQGVLYRDVPYTMLELGLYDLLPLVLPLFYSQVGPATNQEGAEHDNSSQQVANPSWKQEVLAAAIAGGVTAYLTTPLDTIKTKLMVDGYANFWDCYHTIDQLYGWESLWSGSLARVGWLVPLTAIYLPAYDVLKRHMAKDNHNKLISSKPAP
jgi:solute carrier family 25 S-adenosylmethionine transporter 26